MKKIALVLILILVPAVFAGGAGEAVLEEAAAVFDLPGEPWNDYTKFSMYTDYLTIPDFLTGYQANLYKKAVMLHYIFKSSPRELERVPFVGAYADFEALVLSVFTRGLFEQLNRGQQFANRGGELYISQYEQPVQMGMAYAPWVKPDKVELISTGETEIIFEVTGFYFPELPVGSLDDVDGDEITSLTVEIRMTRTAAGWRFSQFATAGNPYVF